MAAWHSLEKQPTFYYWLDALRALCKKTACLTRIAAWGATRWKTRMIALGSAASCSIRNTQFA